MAAERGAAETSRVPRGARSGDLARLLELRRDFCAGERLPWDEGVARRALAELLADPAAGRVWIVEDGGEIVGYAVFTRGFSLEFEGRDGFLDELYVRASHRGRGLARTLLAAVEEGCRELGIRAIHLEVDRDQPRVQELYRRAGFRAHERFLMTKWIPQDGGGRKDGEQDRR